MIPSCGVHQRLLLPRRFSSSVICCSAALDFEDSMDGTVYTRSHNKVTARVMQISQKRAAPGDRLAFQDLPMVL